MFSSDDVPSSKRQRTRSLIRNIALRSFRENGYEETTMRSIADEAGVSVGNTYYHFPTKNHLVQELYRDVQESHRVAAEKSLASTDNLVERLRIAYRTGLHQLTPFHAFASGFLSAAISPKSPINPLSADSAPARDVVLGIFRDAVRGAKHSLPAEYVRVLPTVLWLGYLLLALYWVYDSSAGQARTQQLLDRGLRLFKLALPLARTPLLRKPMRELLDLVAEVGA